MTSDLTHALQSLAKLAKQQAGLGSRLRDAADDPVLWNLLTTELGKIERERADTQAVVDQLEARLAEQQQLIEQLETIPTYCERVRQNLGTFTFEEKRLALEALGIRVTVNGRQWRLEGSIPINDGVMYQPL